MTDGLRLTVLGSGYLGITHAAAMASLGFDVLGVDTDRRKVDQLNGGQLPIYEPGLEELLRDGLAARRVRFTTSYQEAAALGDVHFICTGTPQQPGSNHADLSQVHACVAALAPLLDRPCLVVGKSTVPVGTARRVAAELSHACPGAELAWNPEFLREGTAVADTLSPDRIVVGVTSSRAEQILRQVYARPLAAGAAFIVTTLETAELAKAAANAFLATKISFINAMAEICEAAGGDVRALAQIIGADPRIGPAFLRAGLGYGGGCLPKDIRAFAARAEELGAGASLAFLREVDAINLRRRARTADLTLELAGGNLTGVPVCVLGAAFKPGSDDVRDSPALDVAQILTGMGARVTVHDPAALENARRARPELRYAATVADAARGAHVVLLLTEWREFTALTPGSLSPIVAQRNIIDARNVLDPGVWREAGWEYRALGMAADAEAMTRLDPSAWQA
jgi:UDPglucose 6-dehydrogenase